VLAIIWFMVILEEQKKLEISNGNRLKRILDKNVAIKLTINFLVLILN